MDFQKLVDSFQMAATLMSVEKTDDGHYGDIRLVVANAAYKQIMGPGYHDNVRYDELIPKEPNFEDFCFRCAVKKQHLHAYVDTKSMGVWTDSTYIPVSSEFDEGNLCYMLFFFEFTKAPDASKMANVSMETAPSVIKTCINLRGSENFSESMNTVVADIQEFTDSFSSCIIMIDKEQEKFAFLCAKYRNDCATPEDFLPYLTPEVVFSWEDTIGNHDNIIIKDDFDMCELEKRNPVWVKSLRGAKVESLILVPLRRGKKMHGVLFVTNFDVDRLVEIKEFIELTGFFLTSEIANNDMMERLEYMSNIDTLTGVKNRNSMNARVDWHISGKKSVKVPYGIVFADLNGLKKCNDSGGHEAGDRLLKNAAEILQKQFADYEVYRSGGDEFVVILPDCQKNKFDEMVASFKNASSENTDVSFAIGADWSDNPEDLRLCMHNADEAMYADKKEYYRKNPDKSRG